ncbi:MAG: diguanylate cyclase [Anaerolineales bacterium]|nr:diguanylate cyclase [Anaerolineales bacterium]
MTEDIAHSVIAANDEVMHQRGKIDALILRAESAEESDHAQAKQFYEEAYRLSQAGELSDRPYQDGLIRSLRNLSAINLSLGLYDIAMVQTYEALSLLDGNDPSPETAYILHTLGQIFYRLGNFPEALDYLLKGLKIVELLGLPEQEAMLLTTIGIIYDESGDLEQSQGVFYRALRSLRELGAHKREARVLNRLALTLNKRGEFGQGMQRARRALQISREIESPSLETMSLLTIGQLNLESRDPADAIGYLERSLHIALDFHLRDQLIECKRHLGKAYALQGRSTEALAQLTEAIDLAVDMDAHVELYHCHQLIAAVFEASGDYEHALDHFKRFHATKEQIFNENADQRLASLKVIHQVERVKKDVEIYLLRNVALQQEIDERIRANEALHELAITDPLTGLHNRRHFFYLAGMKFSLAVERGNPLSAIMVDVDEFKQVNDAHGHAVGDAVLQHVAQELKDDLRDSDISARYGGDEFVLVLPMTPYEHAVQVAERLQIRLQKNPCVLNGSVVLVSISLGVASLSPEIESLEDLLAQADANLYAAKEKYRKLAVSDAG